MTKKTNQEDVRVATYGKGQVTIDAIRSAARNVLITEGYNKLTLRQISLQAGITVGNLTYYFRSKEALIKDLLKYVLSEYLFEMERAASASSGSPEHRFVAVIEWLIEDLNTQQTTGFFPELWAMANHDDYVLDRMESVYEGERLVLAELIRAVNPKLDKEQTAIYALFISCSIEGMTMFVGADKKHTYALQSMKATACRSFLNLIKSSD